MPASAPLDVRRTPAQSNAQPARRPEPIAHAQPMAPAEPPAESLRPVPPVDPAPPMPMQPPPRLAPRVAGDGPMPEPAVSDSTDRGATGPQLRRFIKSRAYVPMHELRRRFVINGGDDEVTPVDLADRRRIFVGLPEREGRLLGELLRGGDIGYELSLDPISPIVVGVYPMRPVTRA